MSGFQEILVITLIVLAIFLVPRMRKPSPRSASAAARPAVCHPLLKGRARLAIFLSLLWVGIATAYFQPWRGGLMAFLYAGPGPVALCWGAFWVVRGFRKERRPH